MHEATTPSITTLPLRVVKLTNAIIMASVCSSVMRPLPFSTRFTFTLTKARTLRVNASHVSWTVVDTLALIDATAEYMRACACTPNAVSRLSRSEWADLYARIRWSTPTARKSLQACRTKLSRIRSRWVCRHRVALWRVSLARLCAS